MDFLNTILFWAGILLLLDGALGLIFEEKWQKIAKGINIRRLALIEVGGAILMLILYYLLNL